MEALLTLLVQRARLALQELAPHMALLTLPGGYLIALTGMVHRHWPLNPVRTWKRECRSHLRATWRLGRLPYCSPDARARTALSPLLRCGVPTAWRSSTRLPVRRCEP